MRSFRITPGNDSYFSTNNNMSQINLQLHVNPTRISNRTLQTKPSIRWALAISWSRHECRRLKINKMPRQDNQNSKKFNRTHMVRGHFAIVLVNTLLEKYPELEPSPPSVAKVINRIFRILGIYRDGIPNCFPGIP